MQLLFTNSALQEHVHVQNMYILLLTELKIIRTHGLHSLLSQHTISQVYRCYSIYTLDINK